MHPVIATVTDRVIERSTDARNACLARIDAAAVTGPARGRLAGANVARGFAGVAEPDRNALRRFVKPTGGITPASAASYLEVPNVGCIGGTWLTPRDAVASGDWNRIEQLARQAYASAQQYWSTR